MPIYAIDGKMGELLGFFFDEETWHIRFLVADTGHGLAGKKVLIPADYLQAPKAGEGRFHVDVTREQIRNSPSLSKAESTHNKPEKIGMSDYYILEPSGEISLVGPEPVMVGRFDVHDLYDTDTVKGYAIHATDGVIGHLIDFIFDDESWIVRYLVVDTGGWWPGRKVLLSPEWIESVNWYDNKVFVSVTRQSIKTAPQNDPFNPPDKDYEERIFDHYRRPKYWIPSDTIKEEIEDMDKHQER
jgi:hypothetical protein